MTELIRRYYRPLDIQRFEFIIENVPQDVKMILDVGAWDSQFKEMLNRRGYYVIAVDRAPRSANVLKADITCLPFRDNTFDLITALEILEHLNKEELAAATRELERVSKKYVLISVPDSETPLGAEHKQFFNESRVKGLFKCKNVQIYHFGKRLGYEGIGRYLSRIDRRLLSLYNRIFGDKKKERNNWIIGIFEVK